MKRKNLILTLVGLMFAMFLGAANVYEVRNSGIDVFGVDTLGNVLSSDITSKAAQSLDDPIFTDGTDWTGTNDFAATPAGTAVYVHSSGAGQMTQTTAEMDIAGLANRRYEHIHEVVSVIGTPVCTITSALSLVAHPVSSVVGTHTTYFKAAVAPGNYVFNCTSVVGEAITIDNVSLQEITGGNVTAHGKFTGGGTTGITIDGAGAVNIDADKLLVGAKILPQTFFVTFRVVDGDAAVDYDGSVIVPVVCEVIGVTERHQTLGTNGSAVTVMVAKVPSGTAKASGTDTLSAGISLKGTNDTNVSGTLHGTPANKQLAAGDALALVTTGTLTAVDGVTVTVELKRI